MSKKVQEAACFFTASTPEQEDKYPALSHSEKLKSTETPTPDKAIQTQTEMEFSKSSSGLNSNDRKEKNNAPRRSNK